MTAEELSPEFLTFSAMLDQDECPDTAEAAPGGTLSQKGAKELQAEGVQPFGPDFPAERALLLELRQELRGGAVLPPDFAKSTAKRVEQRWRNSPLKRSLVRVEPYLAASAQTRSALPWTVMVILSAVVAGICSWGALGWLGLGLLTFSCGFIGMSPHQGGPGVSFRQPWPGSSQLAWLFYLVPGLATLATGAVCGLLVAELGRVSLSFRSNSSGLTQLAVGAGVAVSLLLLIGLNPTWKAWKQGAVGRLGWLLPVQLAHGLWLGLALQAVTGSIGELSQQISPEIVVALSLGLSGLLSLALAGLGATKPVAGQLRMGLTQSFLSLSLGGLPILGVLVAFYHVNLTRSIDNPELYQAVVGDVTRYIAQQKAIPAEQNGWMDVKSWLLKPAQETPEYLKVRDRLKGGSEIFEYYLGLANRTPEGTAKASAAEAGFLKELPRIEAALKKPYFSFLATQDLLPDSLSPDFISCRAISQGLAGLAEQARQRGDTAAALRYHQTNLAWSGCVRRGTLIHLMVGIAQQSIALEALQRWVLEGNLDAQQLRSLQASLSSARIDRFEFRETLKRECYFVDQAFLDILRTPSRSMPVIEVPIKPLARLVPSSYWESERKACLNLELAEISGSGELGRAPETNLEEVLAMNLVARQLVPNTARAQAQFMILLTRYSAVETMVALELFRREHGFYPEKLQELVPAYMEGLPVNVVSPKPWRAKPVLSYQRSGATYQLVSESPIYTLVNFKGRQVFGPGHHRLEMTGK